MTRAKKGAECRLLSKQGEKFISAGRERGCDDDPAHFDQILKKVARHKPV